MPEHKDHPVEARDTSGQAHAVDPPKPRAVRSMHEGITACDDPICCCEAEPRWQALGEEIEREEAARRAERRRVRRPKQRGGGPAG